MTRLLPQQRFPGENTVFIRKAESGAGIAGPARFCGADKICRRAPHFEASACVFYFFRLAARERARALRVDFF